MSTSTSVPSDHLSASSAQNSKNVGDFVRFGEFDLDGILSSTPLPSISSDSQVSEALYLSSAPSSKSSELDSGIRVLDSPALDISSDHSMKTSFRDSSSSMNRTQLLHLLSDSTLGTSFLNSSTVENRTNLLDLSSESLEVCESVCMNMKFDENCENRLKRDSENSVFEFCFGFVALITGSSGFLMASVIFMLARGLIRRRRQQRLVVLTGRNDVRYCDKKNVFVVVSLSNLQLDRSFRETKRTFDKRPKSQTLESEVLLPVDVTKFAVNQNEMSII